VPEVPKRERHQQLVVALLAQIQRCVVVLDCLRGLLVQVVCDHARVEVRRALPGLVRRLLDEHQHAPAQVSIT
jgi:hypothetical protein